MIPALVDDYAFELNQAIVETHHQLKQWLPWAITCPSEQETRGFITVAHADWFEEHPKALPLIIEHKFDRHIIGSVGANHCDWAVPSFEVGFWVRATEQGKGYGVEALRAFKKYVFDNLKARRVQITLDVLNEDSIRIVRDAGFKKEAELKHHRLSQSNGHLTNTLILAEYA